VWQSANAQSPPEASHALSKSFMTIGKAGVILKGTGDAGMNDCVGLDVLPANTSM
jgi:hypothetical protein